MASPTDDASLEPTASNTPSTTTGAADDAPTPASTPAAPGADIAAEQAPAPRKRSTRTAESRQAAAKKAAATRARKKAEAAARLAQESAAQVDDASATAVPTGEGSSDSTTAAEGAPVEPATHAEPASGSTRPARRSRRSTAAATTPAPEPTPDVAAPAVVSDETEETDETLEAPLPDREAAFAPAAPGDTLVAETAEDADEDGVRAEDVQATESDSASQATAGADEGEVVDLSGTLPDPSSDPVVVAARGRSRRSTAAAQTPPPAPGFGLLFQAPDPSEFLAPATPAGEDADTDSDVSDDSEHDNREDSDERGSRRSRGRGRGRRRGGRQDAGDGSDEQDGTDAQPQRAGGEAEPSDRDDDGSDDDGDEGDDNGRRRRRRGGRGRRRSGGRGGENVDDAGDNDSDDETGDGGQDDSRSEGSRDSGGRGEGGQTDGGDNGDADSSGSGRRRRRRRRSGSAGDSDDPPGTVTKVREPRDTATGIKGSTRLEAKRQRRREGREAGRRRTIITEAEFLARREAVERVMVVRERGEHTQIGVLEDGILVEHYISGDGSAQGAAGAPGASMAGNVYLGRVQNVLPSMEAAFVDIGKGRNAVLYAGEVNWDAAGLEQHKARRIENALSNGQSVVVQVTKDPIGHKGARLTSQISLPGRYLVYVPGGSMTGISRKLPDTERTRLKKILKSIVPDEAGVIVRTAAEGASEAELTADVERLQRAWEKIQKKAKTGNAPVLLHGEVDLTTRVVRDVFNEDFTKLVVSGEGAWESISDYVESVAPDLADRLQRWTGEKDVFAEYRVDEQIAKAMDRKVWLPSGGSLVIDRTEAMTVVDVNTGKFTGSGGNLEETVTKNNIEAAEEIVRQLRLRDIGGIIVIDFIDMVLESNRELVVRRLVECLGRDRTKHQVAEVTSLGLVQMTRKRVGAGLIEVFSEECEACGGRGIHISTEPLDHGHDSGRGDDRGRGSRSRRGGRGGNGGSGHGGSGHGSSGHGGSGGHGGGRGGSAGHAEGTRSEQTAPTPSGPTPAQIAAAAYAAAVQSHESGATKATDGDAPMETAAVEAIVEEHLSDIEVPVPTSEDVSDGESHRPARRRGSRRASSPTSAPAAPVVEPETAATDVASEAPTAVSGRVTGRVTGRANPPTVASDTPEAASGADSTGGRGPATAEPAVPAATAQPDEPAEAPRTPRRRAGRRAASAPSTAPAGAEAGVFTAEEAPSMSAAPLTVAAADAAPASDDASAPGDDTSDATTPAPRRRRAARRAAGSPAGPPRTTGEPHTAGEH